MDAQLPGVVSSSFSIDGSSPEAYAIEFPGDSTGADIMNTLIFVADNLSAGNHLLKINVTRITESQTFNLDYIVYRASFPSLSAQPAFPPSFPASSPSLSPTVESLPVGSYLRKQDRIGIIVGSILVGILLVILAILLALIWKRRRRKEVVEKPLPEVPQSTRARPGVDPRFASANPINYHYQPASHSRPSTAPGARDSIPFPSRNGRPSTAPDGRRFVYYPAANMRSINELLGQNHSSA